MCARIKHQASIIIKRHFICPSAHKSKDLENLGKEARCEVVTASESRRASGCVGFRPREVGRTGKIVPRYSRAEDVAPQTGRPIDKGVQAGTTRVNVRALLQRRSKRRICKHV
jgi:hypothetical protein